MAKTLEEPIQEKDSLDDLNGNAWLKDTEHVEFLNVENPGLALKFVYGSTRNPQKYFLMHGGKYHLPRKVIDHLESLGAPICNYKPDGSGRMNKEHSGFIQRFTLRRVRT